MKQLFRFLQGYVLVKVRGKNIERFLNLCTVNHVNLWGVCVREDQTCTFWMNMQEVFLLRPYLRKTKTGIVILQKHGLPFLFFRYRERVVFPIACLLVIWFWGFSSQFIWKVELHGNTAITEEQMIYYLSERNMGIWTRKDQINCDQLVLKLRQDFKEIIWASAMVEGTDLIIDIEEKLPENEEVEAVGDCNLTAAKDAVITSIITRTGMPCVKAGDEVKKGDLLVNGTISITRDDGTKADIYTTCAEADIYGRVKYSYNQTISKRVVKKKYTEHHVDGIFIEIFGKRFLFSNKFWNYKTSDFMENYEQLCFQGQLYLPICWGMRTEYKVEQFVEQISYEKAKEQAKAMLLDDIKELQKQNSHVQSQNIKIKEEGDCYRVYGTIVCEEQIGVATPIQHTLRYQKDKVDHEYE